MMTRTGSILAILILAAPAGAEDPKDPLPDVAPKTLAAKIREARARHGQGRLTAEFQEQREPNFGIPQPASEKADQRLLTWPGHLRYASAGRRWKLERDSMTPVGRGKVIPEWWVSGFDGVETYTWQRLSLTSHVTLGHDGSGASAWKPAALFWYQGDTLVQDLEQDVLLDAERSLSQRDVDGTRCYIVAVHSAKNDYGSEVAIAPRRGYLALHTTRLSKGRVNFTYTLSEVHEAAPGLWAPRRIIREGLVYRDDGSSRVYERRELLVTAYDPKQEVADDTLAFEPPLGADVTDHRLGYSYHNDPWWPEVGALFRERFDWPQTDLSVLRWLRTPAEPGMEGKPAPALRDVHWLNTEPVDLARFKGRVVLVEFWDKYACEQVAALRRLYELYRPFGLEMVAIHTPTKDVEAIQKFAREFSLNYPIGIDAEGKFPGATASDWGVQHQPCVFLIDAAGFVHTVGKAQEQEGRLVETVVRLLQEAGAKDVKPLALDPLHVTPEMDKAVRELLKTLVPLAPAAAEVRGRVVDGRGLPIAGANVRGTLDVTILIGASPGGYQLIGPAKSVSAFTDAEGRFSIPNLCKGHYKLEFHAPDRAWRTVHAIVTPELLPVDLDVVLDLGDGIAGRILDESGKPVTGAVLVPNRRRHEVNGAEVTTSLFELSPVRPDDQGRFRLAGLEHGHYEVEVSAPGFEKLTPDPIPAGSENMKFVLKRKPAP
jgi:peroxiredoxin